LYFSNQKIKLYGIISLTCFGMMELTIFLSVDANFWQRTTNHLWMLPFMATTSYFLFEFAIQYLQRKKCNFPVLFLVLILLLSIFSLGTYAWRNMGVLLHTYTELKVFDNLKDGIIYFTVFSFGYLVYFGFGRHLYHHFKLKQTAQQLKIEKQQAELSYLKAQTNPHFLFNTLNNIYSLAREKSDLTAESVLRLSKMLRYMLYETNAANITVEQELKIIDDYIALEKLRYDESLVVNFEHDIENMKQLLPPLLLVPLIENAFKHGVSETGYEPFVKIHLSIINQKLSFMVENSIGFVSNELQVKENIGLSNLRRQLELLFKDYKLNIEKNETVFSVNLEINLTTAIYD
jgi:two-component system, LytTR family, sensor kinase